MANLALRIKTKDGQRILDSLTANSTIAELKNELTSITQTAPNRLHILNGFPPKVFDVSDENAKLGERGLRTGETLIVQEKPISVEEKAMKTVELDEAITEQEACTGILLKRVVPADNSCLFSSVHFVLNGKIDETGSTGPLLRSLVADSIASNPDEYSDAVLGKPVKEYCTWIQDDKSWGGAIELAILSKHFGIEIAVVDTINAIINRFGEDQQFPHRVFLMFDGIHYDPLYMESLDGTGKVRTIFPCTDERILKDAIQLAIEAKSSKQFTDLQQFRLKCVECDVRLKGQEEARDHAKQTGHTSFGEV